MPLHREYFSNMHQIRDGSLANKSTYVILHLEYLVDSHVLNGKLELWRLHVIESLFMGKNSMKSYA